MDAHSSMCLVTRRAPDIRGEFCIYCCRVLCPSHCYTQGWILIKIRGDWNASAYVYSAFKNSRKKEVLLFSEVEQCQMAQTNRHYSVELDIAMHVASLQTLKQFLDVCIVTISNNNYISKKELLCHACATL